MTNFTGIPADSLIESCRTHACWENAISILEDIRDGKDPSRADAQGAREKRSAEAMEAAVAAQKEGLLLAHVEGLYMGFGHLSPLDDSMSQIIRRVEGLALAWRAEGDTPQFRVDTEKLLYLAEPEPA